MREEDLYERLSHLRGVRLKSMEKRASIACGDGFYDDSPEYLKIEEQLCTSRILAIEEELQARSKPIPPSPSPSSSLPGPTPSPSVPRAAPEPISTRHLATDPIPIDDDDEEDIIAVEATAPPVAHVQASQPARRDSHPWDTQVQHSLTHIFHLSQFRPDQREAIDATLAGRDVFCLMPTGGGKSLCYQLPATITKGKTNGLTVVISPLLALIHNQVQSLLKKDIPTIAITGDMSEENRRYATAELYKRDLQVRLLYLTPEFICNSRVAANLFQHLYRQKRLARFVIDEAHCVDQWGHDFRPDYVRLDMLRKEYPDVPIMALTATARIDTVEDIQRHMGMRDALVLRQSFNRPNLTYSVEPKKRGSTLDHIASFIQQKHANECGIIYCLSRRDCENVACDLESKFGIRARHFHAGLTNQDKIRIQEGWEAGQFKVIVATIAFGMGIDKADVRFVIHHSMPKSLEGYYQETGRAGRDGKQSECILFWSMEDARKLETMIKESPDASPEQKRLQLTNMHRVKAFCQSLTECRRTNILKYFGETFDPALCHASCDNCRRTPAHFVDMTAAAKDFVHMVQLIAKTQAQAHFTKMHFMSVFRGSMRKEVKDRGHHLNIYHARGSQYSDEEVKRLVDYLLSENILSEYAKKAAYQRFPNHYLQVGPAATALVQGSRKVCIDMPTPVATHQARRVVARSPSPTVDEMDLTTISLSPPNGKAQGRSSLPLRDRTNTGPTPRPTTKPVSRSIHIAAMPMLGNTRKKT